MTFLSDLSDAFGVSGSEEDVRKMLAAAVRSRVDELRADSIGNLIATIKATGDAAQAAPRLMLCAHMDEVGLMVTGFDDSGKLRFRAIGGVTTQVLPSKPVLVGKKRIPGVIGSKPIHLLKHDERERLARIDSMYIDVGAGSKKEAEGMAQLGDPICFATQCWQTDEIVRGKALDDRVGCAILVEMTKKSYPFHFNVVFSVQEEVGLRGARIAANALKPDAALVIETTVCDDLPKKKDASPVTLMGKGPAVTLMDRSLIADKRWVSLIVATAEANAIPYQFKQPAIGSTDAGAIHLSGQGVPTAVIAVPCRYIHSPAGLISKHDYDNTAKLISLVLDQLGREWPFGKGADHDRS